MKQEISQIHRKKVSQMREIIKEKNAKHKARETQLIAEKKKLSEELNMILQKFTIVEKKIPALKEFFKLDSMKTLYNPHIPEEKILKNASDFNKAPENHFLLKNVVTADKENLF